MIGLSVPPGPGADTSPSPAEIRDVLTAMLAAAQQQGERFLDVTAGGLHLGTGGARGCSKGINRCCRVMHQVMTVGDAELSTSRGATTTTLLIRYALPRWVAPHRPGPTPASHG